MRNPLPWTWCLPARLRQRAAAWASRRGPGPSDAPAAVAPADAVGAPAMATPGIAAAAIATAAEPAGGRPDPPLRGARILLVDDHPIALELTGAVLRRAGAEVVTAAGGEPALQWLAVEKADAVLIDCEMPGLDGYATTRALRARPGLAGLPVIALTGRSTPEDRRRALAAGMNDQVDKPVRAVRLIETLQQWLTKAPGGHPAAGGHTTTRMPAGQTDSSSHD